MCKICCSDPVFTESKAWTVGTGDVISSSSQPSSGFQSAWLGVPGQVSMADIVKMGRPHSKFSTTPNPPIHSVNHQNVHVPLVSDHNLHLSQDHGSKELELHSERGVISSEDFASHDEWPSIEQPPAASLSSVMEASADSELYANSSTLPLDGANQHLKSQLDDVQVVENGPDESPNVNHFGQASVSGRNIQEDDSGGASVFDDNLYKDMSSYQAHGHAYEHETGNYDTSHFLLASYYCCYLQTSCEFSVSVDH